MAPVTKPFLNKAFAVGALVAVAGLSFLVAFTFFKKGGLSEGDSYAVHAYFDDATGLTWKSRVQIAGIVIGEVHKVVLEGRRALLELRIQKDIDLRGDACLTKRFPSALLPDAELEVSPGSGKAPSLRDLPAEQREITCVREAASVQKLLESLAKITADVQIITGDLAKTVAGEKGSVREIIENLASVSRQIERTVSENGDKVAAILDNAEAFTSELRQFAETDRDRFHSIVRNVDKASAQLNDVLQSVQGILGTNQPQLKESFGGLKDALDKLNRSLSHVEEVTQKIAEGKGVAGKLLADERIGERLGNAIEGLSDYVDRLVKLQVQLELRSEWLLNETGAKSYFGLKLLPRPDKYFLIEIVSDPRGVNTVTTTNTSTQDPVTGATSQSISTTVVNERKLTFSAQIAKRYGPATFRIGVIESSGGVGTDLHLFDDHLQISVNLYQFTRPTQDVFPRAKLWVDYRFLDHFYVTTGTDDFLNKWRAQAYPLGPKFSIGRDVFFGGGLYFTDDDIKALLTSFGSAAGAAAGSK